MKLAFRGLHGFGIVPVVPILWDSDVGFYIPLTRLNIVAHSGHEPESQIFQFAQMIIAKNVVITFGLPVRDFRLEECYKAREKKL